MGMLTLAYIKERQGELIGQGYAKGRCTVSKHRFEWYEDIGIFPRLSRCLECGFLTTTPHNNLEDECKPDEQETERQTQRKAADDMEQLQQESASD
jgi:hypothetical protein